MNRFNTISATNLKELTFAYQLGLVNIICGGNMSGKTAVLSAIRLILLGYDGKYGKGNAATFRSCGTAGGGATTLEVSGGFTNHTPITRAWTLKRGSVSYTGPDLAYIPPVLLDPTTYLEMTGPAQLNYVLAQCDVQKLGLGCVPLLFKLAEVLRPLNTTEATGKTIAELVTEIQTLEDDRHDENASVFDWIVTVVDKLTERAKKAKQTADTHEQTVKGLVENKAADGDMSVNASVQPQIDERREAHTAAVTAEANARTEVDRLRTEYRDTKALADKAIDQGDAEQAIAQHQAAAASHRLVPAAGDRPMANLIPTNPRPTDTAEREAVKEWTAKAQEASQRANETTREMKRLEKLVDDAKGETCCPTCGHDISDRQKVVLKELRAQLKAATGKHTSTGAVAAVAAGHEHDATDALQKVTLAIQEWDALKDRLDTANQEAVAGWNAKVTAYNEAQARINATNGIITDIRQLISGNAAAAEAKAKLPGVQAAGTTAAQTLKDAEALVVRLANELADLDTAQRKFVARQQDANRAQQSRDEATAAAHTVAILKTALKVVADEKERVSTEAFKDLLVYARQFTDGLAKAPLEYRDGELGYTHHGNWVHHKSFSGFEELVYFMGLSVALTRQSGSIIKIVMADELGRADASNKQKLVNRLLELIAKGVIDQAFLCDVGSAGYPVADDVKVITVDGGAVTA